MSYDLLCELTLDTGTERISIHGTRTSSGFYDGVIDSTSDLVREITAGGGTSPAQSGSLTIRDAEGKWKKKLESTPFKLRSIVLKLANRSTGSEDQVFSGIISNAIADKGFVEIEYRDDSYDVLNDPITLKVFPDTFADMPLTTPVELIPIVLGTVSSNSFNKQGHLPAYLVDPHETLTVYRYVAAQHPLKSITAVYRNGELVDSADYTVSYANITTSEHGAVRMTFIDFDRDQREAGQDRDALITYDATGLTDDNLETGTLITDPAAALQAFLELRGVLASGDFDSTLVTAATTAYSAAGITVGLGITELGTNRLDVIDSFGESYNLQFFRTMAGKFGMRFDNAAAGSATLEHFDDRGIVDESFKKEEPDDSVSTIEFYYAADYARDEFTARNSFNDSTEQTALGRDVRDELEYAGIRDINQGLKISEIKTFQRRSSRHLVGYVREPEPSLELGDYVKLTHFAGPSSDGLGYQSKVFQVLSLNLRYDDGGIYQEFGLIDAPGLSLSSPSETEEVRSTQTLPPPTAQIFSDIVFTATDRDTVSWSSHDIKLVGGGTAVEYTTVASGDTGNMTLGTQYYIYFDPTVNTAALQTTTAFKTATAPGRWLMCVCRSAPDSADDALIDNRVGFVVVNSNNVPRRTGGDQLPDDTIDTRHLRVDSVTATEINVTNLAAISADMGSITAGTITGATIRTAASGARIQMTSSAFETYDSGSTKRVEIPSGSDRINFYDSGGTLRGAIYGYATNTILQIDGATIGFGSDCQMTTGGTTKLRATQAVTGVLELDAVFSTQLQVGGNAFLRCQAGLVEVMNTYELYINLATEDIKFVDAGSTGATEQDWIEVTVGGTTGYIRVFASK